MTDQDSKDPNFSRETRGEQRSYAGWVIGAVILLTISVVLVAKSPSRTTDEGVIKSGTSVTSSGSNPATTPGTDPSAPVNKQ